MKKNKRSTSFSAVLPVSLQIFRWRLIPIFFLTLTVFTVLLHRIHAAPIVKLRIAVSDLVTPVFSAVSEPIHAAMDGVGSVTGIRDLRAENIRLTEENKRLQQWYDTALRLEAENRSLKSLLNVKVEPEYDFITTRVVADPGGSFIKSILVAAGEEDGIRKGLAVMGEKGMVGRVVEVGRNASRILLVTDLNARIPVVIEGTRHKAILSGQNRDTMVLNHLPLDSLPAVGARIVTSGDGGMLPPHLPIGKIVSHGNGQVQVLPLDDIGQMEFVRVVDSLSDSSLITGKITAKK